MSRVAYLGFVISALASSGCLRATEYQCSSNTACGGDGQCESNGYCSIPDGACASGRRYHDAAGRFAGTCVDAVEPEVDASMADAAVTPDATAPDAVSATCPTGYVTIAGGQSGHLYKVVTTTNDWMAQHTGCQLTTSRAYLAIPDDAAELQALDTAVGGTGTYWVGISDLADEGQWKTVLGATQTFLPWKPPAPDNQNPGEHCVAALAADHMFNDDRCNTNFAAVCECVPP